MSLNALISHWRAEPTVAANIVEWEAAPARPSSTLPLPNDLHPALAAALHSRRVASLYTHQSEAWDQVQAGRHVVICTPTASGKSLAYNLPVLDHLLRDPRARALYLFPTKALAQDQLAGLRALIPGSAIPTAVYDGDTPAAARPTIRSSARLLITNPDMLHAGILPHHTRWADFFHDLRFVVVDEMHTYRGVFGSHVANVLRRLRRIAAFYGAFPQFILTSATIANPVELAGRLVEAEVSLIDRDGSPHGPRHFLIYNPPIVDEALGLRRSALLESLRLAEDLLAYDVQTIVFARSRRSVELLLTYLREHQPAAGAASAPQGSSVGGTWRVDLPEGAPLAQDPDLSTAETLRGYRSGYLPRQRRTIERGLRSGQVRAVVATNALELGIDIGGMGASVMAGYPGTIASTRQQAGRAGRGQETSLAVLVTSASPLDQFIAHHPEYFFGRSPEHALINPDNLLLLLDHLRCAIFELPFRPDEGFGNLPAAEVQGFLDFMVQEQVAHFSGQKYFWLADRYPAERVSLRSASADRIVLQVEQPAGTAAIGEVDIASALWMVHPQAVYMHEAETYLVEELDLEQGLARLRPAVLDYYTEPSSTTTVALIQATETQLARGGLKGHGEIQVTTQVTGFRKVRWYTHEQLGLGELDLPPHELQTTGFWLSLDEETVDRLRQRNLWSNDPNRYGPGWTAIKERVRARDGYRCQACGAPEVDRVHDVHHKIPFRSFASPELANQPHNLITLCPACHHRVELSIRMRSGLAGLAYTLGHLAPLFLMCDTRDIGVHSDPQAPMVNGNPVVVLYDQIPAGIGFSEQLFRLHEDLLERATELVQRCECRDGCPSCVGPAGENGVGGKEEALAILLEMV